MHSDVTAIRFKGANGFLSVFNIYNKITNNDTITCLDSFLTRNSPLLHPSPLDCVLGLGDFNRHHPIWEEEAKERLYEAEEYISLLIHLLYRNEMLLALPKGIPTFQSAAGNWTRPDNVWRSNTPDDPILRCDVVPAICLHLANHMPIITIINMPFPRAAKTHALDFRQANWIKVNEDLAHQLETGTPPSKIRTKDDFITKVDELVKVIKDVLGDHLKERRPSPFTCHWWTKELFQLKKQQNKLSNKSFKLRHVHNHPVHEELKATTNKFKDIMQETHNQDWTNWLEAASQQDLYIANKYILNEPTNYSNARIPSRCTTTNNLPNTADDNSSKTTTLAESFFPPPTHSRVPPNVDYPPPIKGVHFFSRARIHQVIHLLSPYKAPGPDLIPNIVLIKCCDKIIDHLFYIFRAVVELNVYHPRWLESTTLVLRKIGKPSYDVAKAYRPIGLIDTIPKVFSTLCAKHISYLAEKTQPSPLNPIRWQARQKHHGRNALSHTQN